MSSAMRAPAAFAPARAMMSRGRSERRRRAVVVASDDGTTTGDASRKRNDDRASSSASASTSAPPSLPAFLSALGLMRRAVLAGGSARAALDAVTGNAPGVAAKGTIVNVLEDITGKSVSVGTLRLYPDGVVLRGLKIGDDVRVAKLVVRARAEPLLKVVREWNGKDGENGGGGGGADGRATPTTRLGRTPKPKPKPKPPLLIDSIRIKGLRSDNTTWRGVRTAFDLFAHAPGAVLISKLILYDARADITPHASYEGQLAPPRARALRLATLEMRDVDSRVPAAKLAGSVARIVEMGEGGGRVTRGSGTVISPRRPPPPPRAPPSISTRAPSPRRRPAANRDPFEAIRAVAPPSLMRVVDEAITTEALAVVNASQAAFESLAPLVAADAAAAAARAVEIARGASTGEMALDAGVVAALLAAGLPRRFLADGGALLVKLIESGVAIVLLERADVLRVLVERRLLERLLDLDLMDALLDRPELTKAMFRSGVVKGVLSNGVLEALLKTRSTEIATKVLRGEMLEVLMDTGLLPEMMTFRGGVDRPDWTPPTGSVDWEASIDWQ